MKSIGKKSSINKWISKNGVVFLIGMLTLLHCVISSYTAYTTNADFVAINGTYQNYNGIYRLMNGQAPYRDFACYLGVGPTVLGTIVTYLFGGNYAGSLVAMHLLSILSSWLISFVVAYSVFGSKSKAICISAVIINIRIAAETWKFSTVPFFIEDMFRYIYMYIGNSARMVRGLALPLSVILVLLLNKLIDAIENQFSDKVVAVLRILSLSLTASIAFLFSNDYGIGTWVCLTLMVLFGAFVYTLKIGKTIKIFVGYLAGFIGFLCLLVMIVTRGDFSSWLSGIFGAGSYQRWYYLTEPRKNSYLWDLDFSNICMISLVLTCIYLLLFLINRKKFNIAIRRYGIMALLNMTVYAVANEYMLLSGDKLHEMLANVIYMTLVLEILGLVYWCIKRYWNETIGNVLVLLAVMALVIIGSKNRIEVYNYITTDQLDRVTYVDVFGGVMGNELYTDVTTAAEIIGDEKVFSTYASALEVYTDQFQPTGIDYIIHVLGDEKRVEYMQNFQDGNYQYVTTINENYSDWEYWIRNANWFFYRELLQKYHPVAETGYQIIWEKNEDEAQNISYEEVEFELYYNDTNYIVLDVRTENPITGFVELEMEFESIKNETPTSKFVFNPTINIQSPTQYGETLSPYTSFNLPSTGIHRIPVRIINGQGMIVLSSIPAADTALHIEKIVPTMTFVDFENLGLVK